MDGNLNESEKAGIESNGIRPVTVHRLKLKEQYVRPILEGKLRYQVRFDDRGYQAGDIVRFKVVDKQGNRCVPGDITYCDPNEIMLLQGRCFKVDYVMAHEGLKSGYVAFSITEDPRPASVE